MKSHKLLSLFFFLSPPPSSPPKEEFWRKSMQFTSLKTNVSQGFGFKRYECLVTQWRFWKYKCWWESINVDDESINVFFRALFLSPHLANQNMSISIVCRMMHCWFYCNAVNYGQCCCFMEGLRYVTVLEAKGCIISWSVLMSNNIHSWHHCR